MYGGIEAGGTKFVCAVSDEGVIVEKISIPTTAPEETLKQVFDFFDQYELEAMGIGSFGPIGIDKSTDSYGYVLATPKKVGRITIFWGVSKTIMIFQLHGRQM